MFCLTIDGLLRIPVLHRTDGEVLASVNSGNIMGQNAAFSVLAGAFELISAIDGSNGCGSCLGGALCRVELRWFLLADYGLRLSAKAD